MANSTNTITFELPAIDSEHDIHPQVVIVPDYNGSPIIHVFITGERVIRIDVEADWQHEFTLCTTTAERQAFEALAYHLGELNEDQDQLLAGAWGTSDEPDQFDTVTSYIDGHLLCAFVDRVALAAFDHMVLTEDSPFPAVTRPTGL